MSKLNLIYKKEKMLFSRISALINIYFEICILLMHKEVIPTVVDNISLSNLGIM